MEDSILRPPPQPPSSASSCPFRWSGGQGELTQRAARTHLDGYGAPEEAGARRGDRLLPAVCLRAVCVRGEASVLVHRAPETLPWLHTGREQVSQANKPALTSIVSLTCSSPKQWHDDSLTWNNDYEVKGGCLRFDMRVVTVNYGSCVNFFLPFSNTYSFKCRKNSRKGILNIQQGNQGFTLLTLLVNWAYIEPAKDWKINRKWSWLQCRTERAPAGRIGSVCKGSVCKRTVWYMDWKVRPIIHFTKASKRRLHWFQMIGCKLMRNQPLFSINSSLMRPWSHSLVLGLFQHSVMFI